MYTKIKKLKEGSATEKRAFPHSLTFRFVSKIYIVIIDILNYLCLCFCFWDKKQKFKAYFLQQKITPSSVYVKDCTNKHLMMMMILNTFDIIFFHKQKNLFFYLCEKRKRKRKTGALSLQVKLSTVSLKPYSELMFLNPYT